VQGMARAVRIRVIAWSQTSWDISSRGPATPPGLGGTFFATWEFACDQEFIAGLYYKEARSLQS
jgi:hypothetical protein